MDIEVLTTKEALLADLESLWQALDTLLDSLNPSDWARKHGRHWVFADVPYHLAYFDRDIVAAAVARGAGIPAAEQRPLRTTAELNAWNAAKFAARPASQTVAESLAQMRASRAEVRRVVAGLTEADLDRPAWCPLPGMGWTTARMALHGCFGHTWNHFVQARLWLKRATPVLTPGQVRRGLDFYLGMFPGFVDRAQAAQTPLTVRLVITGPGGGTWTMRVADGTCRLIDSATGPADLVMTQSADTFLKTLNEMHNPMLAMLTGQIKIKGFRNMGTFGKLFHPPALDQPLDYNPTPVGALG